MDAQAIDSNGCGPRVVQYLGSTDEIGGTESYVLTLCEHLSREQISVTLACTIQNRAEIVPRAAAKGVAVHVLAPQGRDRLSYLKRTLDLTRLLRRRRADVLHVHTTGFGGFNALIAGWIARVPSIVVTHHGWFGPTPDSLLRHTSLWLEKHLAKRVIALYTRQARELASTGVRATQVKVIPCGVDVRRFRNGDVPAVNVPAEFRLSLVARMAEGKGHEQLLNAIALLIGRYPQLRLLLVGDGPLRSRIEDQIENLGLNDVVELTGWVPNEQVPEMLRHAQVTVLPSYMPGEAFPVTLLEGMAMGLAAIGTRWVGIPDMIVHGETGLIVEPQDVTGLAEAIERLVVDPRLTADMGRRGRERVYQLFSAEVMAKSHAAVYKEIAAA